MIITRGITCQRHILIWGMIIITSTVRRRGSPRCMDVKEQLCSLLWRVSDIISSEAPHNISLPACSALAAPFDSENY